MPVAADYHFRQDGGRGVHENWRRIGSSDRAQTAMAHVGEEEYKIATLIDAEVVHDVRKVNFRGVRAAPVTLDNVN